MSRSDDKPRRGPGRPRKDAAVQPDEQLEEEKDGPPTKEERNRRYADVQFQRQCLGLPSSVGHTLDMLWHYFTKMEDTRKGDAGRDHVLTIVDYIEFIRVRLERAREQRFGDDV